MWLLHHKEGWAPKSWCFWTAVLEKTLESPLDSKEINPVDSKGNQHCIFIGRTDAAPEAPALWPADRKRRLIGKDPDVGKDWCQEEKGTTEDEMVWWCRLWSWVWANSGRLWRTGKPRMLQSWGRKKSDTTEQLNNNNKQWVGVRVTANWALIQQSSAVPTNCLMDCPLQTSQDPTPKVAPICLQAPSALHVTFFFRIGLPLAPLLKVYWSLYRSCTGI